VKQQPPEKIGGETVRPDQLASVPPHRRSLSGKKITSMPATPRMASANVRTRQIPSLEIPRAPGMPQLERLRPRPVPAVDEPDPMSGEQREIQGDTAPSPPRIRARLAHRFRLQTRPRLAHRCHLRPRPGLAHRCQPPAPRHHNGGRATTPAAHRR
jgi:hypothetical protein